MSDKDLERLADRVVRDLVGNGKNPDPKPKSK